MKPTSVSISILSVCLFVGPSLAAQTPLAANRSTASTAQSTSTAWARRLIRFSGTLLNAQDRPMSGPVGVTFAVYSQQAGGAALWMETQNVKPDASGVYTVLLGANSANGVPAELFVSEEARWLGVQAERQAEQPRTLLVSVPYAVKAEEAERLAGRPASDFVLAESLGAALQHVLQAQTENSSTKLSPTIKSSTTSNTLAVLPLVTSSGQTLFTGTTTAPSPLVEIQQKGTGDALLLQSLLAPGTSNYLIHGQAGATPADVFKVNTHGDVVAALGTYSGTTTAVNTGILTVTQGGATSTAPSPTSLPPAAVVGRATATSGSAAGVLGVSAAPTEVGAGVLGINTTASAKSTGVGGLAMSTQGRGVTGLATATSGGTEGVAGEVHSPNGIAGLFLNTAGGYVLYTSTGSTGQTPVFTVNTTTGGHFFGGLMVDGSLKVSGNLNVSGSKHAVQMLPDGRNVALNALETPESWFEDFGSATLHHGVVTIKLDATFAQTVNTVIEYHVFLTPSGNCRGLYVAEKSPDGFEVREVKKGKSNVTFDYRVVARRRGFEKERLEEIAH